MAVLFVASLCAVVLCVWHDRTAWVIPHHLAVTAATIAFLTAGLYLCTKRNDTWTNALFHSWTGAWHLNTLLGLWSFMVCTVALIYAIGCRVVDDHHIDWVMCHVKLSTFVTWQVTAAALAWSHAAQHHTGYLFDIAPDGWLTIFWVAFAAGEGWALCYLVRLLWVIRADPAQRVTANFFIAGVALGAVCQIVMVACVLTPLYWLRDAGVWASATGAIGMLACGVARSSGVYSGRSRLAR